MTRASISRFGMATTEGEDQAPPILQGQAIKPFISLDLLEKSRPVQFLPPTGAGPVGIEPRFCRLK